MNRTERIYYLDILKTIAIFGIIFIHVSILAGETCIKGINITNFVEVFKFSVPIFLMITGTLLLNRNYSSLSDFFKRKLSRITFPYLFWFIFILIAVIFGSQPETYSNFVSFFFTTFFNFNMSWYFWMILGIYFTIPIINAFVTNEGMEGCKYFILMFIFASIFYQILIYFKFASFIDLRLFIYPFGFLVLGYYLSNHEFKNRNAVIILSIIIFLVTTVIKVRFDIFPMELTHLIVDNASLGQLSFIDVSILQILQASSVFLLIRYISDYLSVFKKFCISISRASYGMYLSHIPVYLFLFHYLQIPKTGTGAFLTIILGSLIIFFISWILVLILSKIPYIKKLSGYA